MVADYLTIAGSWLLVAYIPVVVPSIYRELHVLMVATAFGNLV